MAEEKSRPDGLASPDRGDNIPSTIESSPNNAEEIKVSRRGFIKWAGALAAIGVVGIVGGSSAKGLWGRKAERAPGGPVILSERPSPAASSTTPLGTPPAPNSFSIFWITDTQFLSESNPDLFKTMNNWIVNQWDAYNGKLVIHTGDVVQTGNVQQEWENACDAMSIFNQNGIPYTWCAGNHDDWVLDNQNTAWMGNIWGAPAFDPLTARDFVNSVSYTEWVGDYHLGMNTALTFTANGLNFLVINIEWNANPDVLQWAEGILDDPAYSSYYAIVAPHAYVDSSGSDDDDRWGSTMANFVGGLVPMLDSHPNVFLTLNGHFATDSGYNTPHPVNGRNQLMFDRQDCCDLPGESTGRGVDDTSDAEDSTRVGGATVTILNFDTANNQINVSTYDTYLQQWRVDSPNQYAVGMLPSPPVMAPQTRGPRDLGPRSRLFGSLPEIL